MHSANDRDAVREALEAGQAKVDLELEPIAAGENRMIGIALAPAAHSTVDVDNSVQPAAMAGGTDDDAIRETITKWSSLHPDEMKDGWKEHCTEPYYHFSPGGVAAVDGKAVEGWLKSDDFGAIKSKFGYHDTRKVTISDVKITYLGGGAACATYRHREEGTVGKPIVGNGAVMLHKTKGATGPKWKIGVVGRHDVFEGA